MDRTMRDFIARKHSGHSERSMRGTYRMEGEYERRPYDDGYGGRHHEDFDDDEYYEHHDRREHGGRSDRAEYRHHEEYKLSRSDLKRWKSMLENADGTRGPHFDMIQIMGVAEKIGVKFHDYDDREFCMAVNMMYADYGEVIRHHVGPEKELQCCAELAKAFLEDVDGPDPSEKLALYYYCIVDA